MCSCALPFTYPFVCGEGLPLAVGFVEALTIVGAPPLQPEHIMVSKVECCRLL